MVEQEILEMLTTMVEDKDIYTAGHSKRVAMYSVRLAQAMGLSEDEQTTIYQSGLLHDIGKILTPESVLLKPKKYNHQEYTIIKNHSADGEKMVLFIFSFKEYATIIRHHHERFDGEGYPDALSGSDIPLLSRIMSVADSFDAMTTNRIYKARKTIDQAFAELQKCSARNLTRRSWRTRKWHFLILENWSILRKHLKTILMNSGLLTFSKTH
jgi:putative nucleotidyltransferase with HDIG domain